MGYIYEANVSNALLPSNFSITCGAQHLLTAPRDTDLRFVDVLLGGAYLSTHFP